MLIQLGLLRRLHTFSLPEITTPTHPSPVANDIIIRKLSILSQLAVFLDVIPGYRIRSLSDKEKAEKVGQLVARTREWEQGLVSVYQNFLKTLEAEIKGVFHECESPSAKTAMQGERNWQMMHYTACVLYWNNGRISTFVSI